MPSLRLGSVAPDFEAGPTQSTGAADSAPNTLPQILHLSYKNHGQFLLESMQYGLAHQRAVTAAFPWPADIAERLITSLAHLEPE